jgi:hypothetical protein
MDKYPLDVINKKINECGQQLEKDWGSKLPVFRRKPCLETDTIWWVQGKELGIDEENLAKFCALTRVEHAIMIAVDKVFEGDKSFLKLAENYENLLGLVIKKFSFQEDVLWGIYETNFDKFKEFGKLEKTLRTSIFTDKFKFDPDRFFELKSTVSELNCENFSIIFGDSFPKKTVLNVNKLMVAYDKAQCIFDDYSDILDDIAKKECNGNLFFIVKYGSRDFVDWNEQLWGDTAQSVKFNDFEKRFLKDSSYIKLKEFYSNLQRGAKKYKFPGNAYLFKKEGWDLPFEKRIEEHMKTAVI